MPPNRIEIIAPMPRTSSWSESMHNRLRDAASPTGTGGIVGALVLVTAITVTLEILKRFIELPPITALACSPDGKTIAVPGADGIVQLIDATAGTVQRSLKGHTGIVTAVAFSPQGATLATAGNDRTVKIWSLPKGELRDMLAGHTNRVVALVYARDGNSGTSVERTPYLERGGVECE